MKNCKAMEGSESGVDKQISFGFNLADERIKLIDILSEDDDDFLVASPFCDSFSESFSDNFGGQTGFRLSGFRNFQEIETIQQKEKSPENIVKKSRPSFLRRSLAWDSAFFSSAGVLDPDELSLINKGAATIEDHLLPSNRDVRTRRSGLESMANDDGSRHDWFEIEPFDNNKASVNKSKSSQGSLKNSQPQKKVEKSFTDKATERSGKVAKSSPKPPKASSGRTVNNFTRSNNSDSSGKSNVKMENKSGQSSVVEKKFASQKSSNLNLSRLSSPKFSSILSPIASLGTSSPQASSSILRRKTETRKSKLSISLSASQIWNDFERSRGMGNVNHSTSHLNTTHCSSKLFSSSLGSVDKKQRSNESKIDFDTKVTTRGLSLHNDAKEATDLQRKSPKLYSSSNAAAQTCSLGSLSAKNFRPSELRPPSPAFGFFDENTPLSSHGEIISRKLSQKVLSERTLLDANSEFRFSSSNIEILPDSSLNHRHTSAYRNTTSPSSDMGRKIKRSKSPPRMNPSLVIDKEKFLESRRSVSDGKRPRYKLRSNPILEEEKSKGSVLKNKRCKESCDPLDEETGKKKLHTSTDQIGFLSKYFEAIDLNQNKKTMQHEENQVVVKTPNALSKRCSLSALSSVSSMRTPLADSNFIRTIALTMDPKKGKLVKMASLYSSGKEKRTRTSSSMFTS